MSSPIVCGTDLGVSGGLAMDLAAKLAAVEQRPLRIVYAGEPHLDDSEEVLAEMRPYAIALREQLRWREAERNEALRALRDKFGSIQDVAVERIEGRPWEALVSYAASVHAKAIVVGPHSANASGTEVSSRFIGTTASRVLHHAPCDVWVTRGAVPSTLKGCRIVVGIDFGPESIAAVREAARLARNASGTVILAHVLSLSSEVVVGAASTRRLLLDWSAKSDAALRKVAAEHCKEVPTEVVSTHGAPASALAGLAHDRSAGLLIVGTHGRRGIRRLFVGSVAEGCVVHSPVPVLVTRIGERGELT